MTLARVGGDVAELVPGKLFAVSGLIPLDGRVSWVPEGVTGYQPANCYVLRQGSSVLVLDPGASAHEAVVMRALEPILAGATEISVFLTRAELDTMGNIGAVAERYPLKEVYAGIGGGNPFDAYDAGVLIDPKVRSSHVDMQRLAEGQKLAVGEGRTFELVMPALRLLSTFWGYDSLTRALFTADLFSHQNLKREDDPRVSDEPDPETTMETVRAHLRTKFWWTGHAETAPLKKGLVNLFDKFDIEIIAPTHGSVLRGKKTVARHLELLLEALG